MKLSSIYICISMVSCLLIRKGKVWKWKSDEISFSWIIAEIILFNLIWLVSFCLFCTLNVIHRYVYSYLFLSSYFLKISCTIQLFPITIDCTVGSAAGQLAVSQHVAGSIVLFLQGATFEKLLLYLITLFWGA